MKRGLATAIVTVVFPAAIALFGTAGAGADPDYHCAGFIMTYYQAAYCDPHIPDPLHDHCLGGRMGSLTQDGYCDGEPYPDGSYWHLTQYGSPTVDSPNGWMSLAKECVVHDGGAGTQPAPPGGCGGAA
jgi:hypothetical protein